jgi:hypothetical protein
MAATEQRPAGAFREVQRADRFLKHEEHEEYEEHEDMTADHDTPRH